MHYKISTLSHFEALFLGNFGKSEIEAVFTRNYRNSTTLTGTL